MLQLVPKRSFGEALPRMWWVFFGEAIGSPWWARLLKPGFRHVSAACWHVETKRWVYFNPLRRGHLIEVYEEGEFPLLGLVEASTVTLRFTSEFGRTATPVFGHCVATVMALLGIRGRAFTPFGLFRDLRARGAEIVEAPPREVPLGQHGCPAAAAGRS